MTRTLVRVFAVFILFACGASMAANRYVRSGATGANNGSDWANAYTALPASLVRGDTYYVASGNYPSYTFKDPESGNLTITVKKATANDHGTDVGWVATYAVGQAVFASTIRFERSNYIFDGQVRNEANWFDGASYGFRINHNNKDQNIVISNYGVSINSISVKYVFVDAIYGSLPTNTIRRYAIDTDGFDGGTTAKNLLFHRMYVRGSNNVWFLRTTDGAIVEYSASDGAMNNAANHGEIVNLYYSGNNAIIRYNQWKNAFVDGGAANGGTALVAITYANGLQFYGNIVSNFATGDGAIGYDGAYSSKNRVYNNTFINGIGYNSGTAWGSGSDNIVYNNIFINCNVVRLAGTHDFNSFSDSNTRGEANAQTNVPTSIFVNFPAGDYRLASETRAGTLLPAPYNIDLFGVSRGVDGTVSRGAYEFVSGSSAALPVPLGLTVK